MAIEIGTKTHTIQVEIVDRFGDVLELECRVEHLANGKLDAGMQCYHD